VYSHVSSSGGVARVVLHADTEANEGRRGSRDGHGSNDGGLGVRKTAALVAGRGGVARSSNDRRHAENGGGDEGKGEHLGRRKSARGERETEGRRGCRGTVGGNRGRSERILYGGLL
jgi:hypothetical protein